MASRHSISGAKKRLRHAYLLNFLGDTCHYCTNPGTTLDHIVPISFEGSCWAIWNLVLACNDCNQLKANTLFYCKCSRCEYAYQSYNELRHSQDKTLRHIKGVTDKCVICLNTYSAIGCVGPK